MTSHRHNPGASNCWSDAGECLGVYTDAEADWLEWTAESGEARYIRNGDTVAADEAVISLAGCHHGAHAAIAVRAVKGSAA